MKRSFTLLEMLAVIAIIAVLAAIAIPAALLARHKGRVTTAKSEMHSIQLAFKGLENTYKKMVTVSGGKVTFNGKNASENSKTISSKEYKYVRFDGSNEDLYDNVIIELSDAARITNADKLNVNKRRLTVLEPKPEYDASTTIAKNQAALWRDPWGKPYVILINTNRTNAIPDPNDSTKLVGGTILLYSYGPDGIDNKGDSDSDDVCSWK